MIKIVKEPEYKIVTTKYFVCRGCGCEFLADATEYTGVLHCDTLRPICRYPNCSLFAESSAAKLAQYQLATEVEN